MSKQDSSRKQFSVLLNYNKNQSNSDASDFVAMYSKDIMLPPMSKVALYSASLIRKPIVLTTDQSFSLSLTDAYSYPKGKFEPSTGFYEIQVPIEKGSYSKREFLDHLEVQTQDAIDTFIFDFSNNKFLEYRPVIDIGKDRIFYSITPYVNPEGFFPVSETADSSNNIDSTFAVGIAPSYNGTDAGTWNNFAFARSSIFPFTRNHREDYDTNQNDTDWFFKVDLSGTEQCFAGFLSQAYQKQQWASSSEVQVSDVLNTGVGEVPNCYLGLCFNKASAGSNAVTMSIVADAGLSERTSSTVAITQMVSLVDLKISDITASGLFGFKFYYENTQNNQQIEYDKFYFKVYAKQSQTANYYNVTMDDVLFDSRTINLAIPRELIIESFQQLGDDCGGMVPFIAFKNVPNSTDKGSVSLNIMNINQVNDADTWKNSIGISRFSIVDVTEELSYVFGFDEQNMLDPNSYPTLVSPDTGVVSLYSDSIGYNVEINNLSVQTQSNTVNTNPGNARPCVYRLQNEESDLSDFNQTYRRFTHYSPQIKWTDIENREYLNLNNLNIKIRRDITNQQANEIVDTKLELLFC